MVVLAESAGCSQSYLSEIENGKRAPSRSMAIAIAHALSASEHWLLTGEGERDVRTVAVSLEDDFQVPADQLVVRKTDADLYELRKALEVWWQTASADEKAWLRVHLRQTVPGYGGKTRPGGS